MFVELGDKRCQELSLLLVRYRLFILEACTLLEKFVQAQAQECLINSCLLRIIDILTALKIVEGSVKPAISADYVATELRYVFRCVCIFQHLVRIVLLSQFIFQFFVLGPKYVDRLYIVLYFG